MAMPTKYLQRLKTQSQILPMRIQSVVSMFIINFGGEENNVFIR